MRFLERDGDGPLARADVLGRLLDGELEIFVSGAKPIPRLKPENLEALGFDLDDPEANRWAR